MQKIKNFLKVTKFGKKIRKEKWQRRVRNSMLSKREIKEVRKKPENLQVIIKKRLDDLPNQGRDLIESLDNIIDNSKLNNLCYEDKKELKEDMLKWYFIYGYTFNEYISYKFFEKRNEERLEFLSDRDIILICYEYNDIEDMSIISNKSKTYEKFKKYFKRDVISINNNTDFKEVESFFNKHHKFIKKNVFESCGRGVEIIDLKNENKNIEELFREFELEGDLILEELVTQTDDLAKFNQSSVNTLRCITFNTNNGIKTPFFFMRFGRKGKSIDNGAAGGLIVEVNSDNGTLGEATDEYGNRFKYHPDSKLNFEGFRIPDWDEAIEICKDISSQIPTVSIIGWDLAHTKDGWVIIEGNSMTEIIGVQSTKLKGIRTEIEKLIKNM